LSGKEDVVFEKDVSTDANNIYYAYLFPLGVRNDSEVIFRNSDHSIFVKYDLKTKEFSTIYHYKKNVASDFGNFGDRVTEGQTNSQNSTIYLNSFDKVAFIREVTIYHDEKDPKSINQHAGILSLLDLKTGKVEKLYSTGFHSNIGNIGNLKVSTDEKMLGFQFFYLGADSPSNEKNELVTVDLTTNKTKVVDFPSLNKATSYGDSHFKGFSNDKELLFEFNLNSTNSKDITLDYQIVKYNIETKVLRKIISLSTTVPFNSLGLGSSSEGGLHGYNLAQIW